MRISIVLALAASLLFPMTLSAKGQALSDSPPPQATAAKTPKWTLQVDPLTTALGLAHLHVEYAFSDYHSLYLSPSIRLLDSPLNDDEYDAVGLEAAYRYFWRGNAPFGPWASVRVVGSRLTKDSDSEFGGYAGVLGGYTWLVGERFTLAMGLGVQYFEFQVSGVGVQGFLPAAHTALGVAF